VGTINSKPLGPIIMIDQSELLGRSNSFLEVQNFVTSFTSHGTLHAFGAEKPIS
jgi:hypothetical protein